MLLTERQQAGLTSADPWQQQRIDKLLSGTRMLLHKYLSPDQLVALQREVRFGPGAPNQRSWHRNAAPRDTHRAGDTGRGSNAASSRRSAPGRATLLIVARTVNEGWAHLAGHGHRVSRNNGPESLNTEH